MSRQAFGFVVVAALWFGIGLWIGYAYPRDLELESTAPVEFHYEITKEAAREMILKAVEDCPTASTE